MISPANWEGCESEQKVLAQVELFPTFPAFQSEGTNKLRDASRSHHSQCHQRAQKNKGKRARTSHTALPNTSSPSTFPSTGNAYAKDPALQSSLPSLLPLGQVSVPSATLAVQQEPFQWGHSISSLWRCKTAVPDTNLPLRPLCSFITGYKRAQLQ